MKIDKMRWYKIDIDGRLWFTGSCAGCKKWVENHLVKKDYPYTIEGGMK